MTPEEFMKKIVSCKFIDPKKQDSEKKPSEEIEQLILSDRNSNPQFNSLAPVTDYERINAIEKWLDENWPKVVKK